jgi:hypothetical protein
MISSISLSSSSSAVSSALAKASMVRQLRIDASKISARLIQTGNEPFR